MSKPKNTVMEYRNYYLPADFPVLVLTGGHWKISDIPAAVSIFTTAWKSASATPIAAR